MSLYQLIGCDSVAWMQIKLNLSNEIMAHSPSGKFVIVAGRYTDECKVQSNKDINTTPNGKS